MKRQTTHPEKRSRQERALEQRRAQLDQWVHDPGSIGERCPGDEHDQKDKIKKAEDEIAVLEKKLGVRHHD